MESEDYWEALKNENLTEAQYLDRVLGPKHLPMELVLPMTFVYVMIFITGVFGNITTCLVICKNSSMQNATNYYLTSLAISDLMLLILGLPNELSVFWQQYPYALGIGLCKTRAYVSEMSSYVSVITIVAFSSERYSAICRPFSSNKMSSSKRLIPIILMLWLTAGISALPFAIYADVIYIEYPPDSGNYSLDSAICTTIFPRFPFYELSCACFFLIPMIIITYLYIKMGLTLRRSIKNPTLANADFRHSIQRENKRIRSRRSIIRMLSAVVVMFFICWAPFHAQRLLYVYGQAFDFYPDLSEWLYLLSGCLYYVSTTVNPILYNVMSTRYRIAFKKTLLCSKSKMSKRKKSYNSDFSNKEGINFQKTFGSAGINLQELLNSKNKSHKKVDDKEYLKIDYDTNSNMHRVAMQKLSVESALTKYTIVTNYERND